MSRDLTPSDRKVWSRVARTVSPRRRDRGKQASKPYPTRDDFSAMMRLPPLEQKAPPMGTAPETHDKKVRRGQVEIDARLDLHGMTQEQARRKLATTLLRSAKRGHCCLLVITGKGPRLEGVLRTALPQWLSEPDIRPMISRYAPAHIRHGGSGAWYVFLA